MVDITDVLADIKIWLLALAYATTRIQMALAIIPLFNKQLVPGLIRTGIGVCVSLVLVPPIRATLGSSMPDTATIVFTLLKEGVIGLLFGFAVAVLFWAVEAVGFFVDNQRGASIASTLNPQTGNDTSPLGLMFNQAFVVYFLVAGGFTVLLGMFYQSFRIWPVVSFFPTLTPEGIPEFAGLFANLVRLGLLLASPVLVAMLLAELGLALVSRFAPQLQVFFLAMPIKSAIAFLVLVLYLPTMFSYIRDEIGRLPGLLDLLGRSMR
jgi:type III secretion protein T